jgi:hypothetical protein
MIARLVVILFAIAAALIPWPSHAVERWYSQGLYLRVQPVVTSISNRVPIAWFDLALGLLLVLGAVVFVRRTRRNGFRAALRQTAGSALVTCAVLYLLFLVLWGLNYRRVPLEQKLDYAASRVTRDAALRLGGDAATRVNRDYATAHAIAPDIAALERAFGQAERSLGSTRFASPGIPKRSLLSFYFKRAAIDGMTDPFFLEIILNPEVLPIERPFVLAHEWAHLAGYADESEANFVAWLTCIRGDTLAQYSGWFAAYQHAWGALSREDRLMLPSLDAGPRDDLRAMAVRYRRSSPAVRTAARNVYDRYLKANRVPEGIASYEAVVRLMLGTEFDSEWRPLRRQ